MSWGTLLQTHKQAKTSETWRPLKLVSLHHEKEETFKVEEVKTVIVVFRRKSRREFLKFLPSTQNPTSFPPVTGSLHHLIAFTNNHVTTSHTRWPRPVTDGLWCSSGDSVVVWFNTSGLSLSIVTSETPRGQRTEGSAALSFTIQLKPFQIGFLWPSLALSDCFFISGVRTFVWRWRRRETRWFFIFFWRSHLTPCWPSPSCLNPRMHCCSDLVAQTLCSGSWGETQIYKDGPKYLTVTSTVMNGFTEALNPSELQFPLRRSRVRRMRQIRGN